MTRQRDRVRRVNAKRPAAPRLELYPLPANDATEAVLDYIAFLLDERGGVGKG